MKVDEMDQGEEEKAPTTTACPERRRDKICLQVELESKSDGI